MASAATTGKYYKQLFKILQDEDTATLLGFHPEGLAKGDNLQFFVKWTLDMVSIKKEYEALGVVLTAWCILAYDGTIPGGRDPFIAEVEAIYGETGYDACFSMIDHLWRYNQEHPMPENLSSGDVEMLSTIGISLQ